MPTLAPPLELDPVPQPEPQLLPVRALAAGFRTILPSTTFASRIGHAAKKSGFEGRLRRLVPNTMPHKPGSTIALPCDDFSGPIDLPLDASSALIVPAPKLPIRIAPLNVP